MNEHNYPRWLDYFAGQKTCSDSFLQVMDVELRQHFRKLTGIDLGVGFQLAPPIPEAFQIRSRANISYLEGFLVDSHMGFRVRIAWSNRAQARIVQPEGEIAMSEVRFWWDYLPIAEIQERESRPVQIPFNDMHLSFSVEFNVRIWPHVCLKLRFNCAVKTAKLKALQILFNEAQIEWNATQGQRYGIIHSVGQAQLQNAQTVVIQVDFGSAWPKVLEYVLERLDAFDDIACVRLNSY